MSTDRTSPPKRHPCTITAKPAPARSGATASPLCLLACFGTACVGAPNALAPGLRGSIGMPHSGVQTEAVELPQRGEGFVRFRPQSPTHWGNPRLVSAIQDVARAVLTKSPDTAPLVVGDLSGRYGGKIPRH